MGKIKCKYISNSKELKITTNSLEIGERKVEREKERQIKSICMRKDVGQDDDRNSILVYITFFVSLSQ